MATEVFENDDAGDGDEGSPAWMATFADLCTLLLTFFVLLLSFANMDVEEFRAALGSVREALGVQYEHPGQHVGLTTSIVELGKRESTDQMSFIEDIAISKVQEAAKEQGKEGAVSAERGAHGIHVRIEDRLMYEAGEARLLKNAKSALELIVEMANDLPTYEIIVEGHTDDRPIFTKRFPSNWELSSVRAASALRYLVRRGVARERLRVVAYGPVKPVASNHTLVGRRRNRRVEFVFVAPSHPKASVDSKADPQ